MGTPDLTASLTRSGALVLGLTLLGELAAVTDPGLVATRPPHPALTGTIGDALSILAANARTLAIPFAFDLLGLAMSRPGRLLGDVGILAVTAISTVNVGLALGRWGTRLLPYIPQLPLEWAALAFAISAWLHTRDQQTSRRALLPMAALTAALLIAAAAVETWATPHRPAAVAAADGVVSPGRSRGQTGPANFAGARAGGRRTTINPRPPGGDHMNSVSLIGNLTRDPELRTTPSGASVSDLRIAINRPKRNGEDQGADYVDIVVWGATAENCAKYLAKGRPIAVSGRLRHTEWQTDGNRRSKLEVVAEQIDFLNAATPTVPVGGSDTPAQEPAAA